MVLITVARPAFVSLCKHGTDDHGHPHYQHTAAATSKRAISHLSLDAAHLRARNSDITRYRCPAAGQHSEGPAQACCRAQAGVVTHQVLSRPIQAVCCDDRMIGSHQSTYVMFLDTRCKSWHDDRKKLKIEIIANQCRRHRLARPSSLSPRRFISQAGQTGYPRTPSISNHEQARCVALHVGCGWGGMALYWACWTRRLAAAFHHACVRRQPSCCRCVLAVLCLSRVAAVHMW